MEAGKIIAGLPCATTIAALATAGAAGAYNVTGTWEGAYRCESGWCAGQEFPGTTQYYEAEGCADVIGSDGSETIVGTLYGNKLTTRSEVGSYSSEGSGTLSPSGNEVEGPSHDSNGTSGTGHEHRISSSETLTPYSGCAHPDPEDVAGPPPSTPAAAAVQVSCTYEVALDYFSCTAQVADASGESPAKIPTGSVTFSLKPGGEGSFPLGPSCTLGGSPGGGPTSFCTVRYEPGVEGIPPGMQPAIVAAYSGDAAFKPASGEPRNVFAAEPAAYETARELACGALWTAACSSLLATAKAPGSCVSLTEACRGATVESLRERLVEIAGTPESLSSLADCEEAGASAASVRARMALTYNELHEKYGTRCEIEAALKSEDPEVLAQAKEALEWDANRRLWQMEVEERRLATEKALSETCATAAKSGCVLAASQLEQVGEVVDRLYEGLKSSVGTPNRTGSAELDPNALCAEVQGAAYVDCVANVRILGEHVDQDVEALRAKKSEYGLTVPKPEVKAKKSSLRSGAAVAASGGHRRSLSLAWGNATLKAGRKGRLRIVFSPEARGLLRKLRARHVHILRATVTIRTTVFGGLSRTRRVHVRLRLR